MNQYNCVLFLVSAEAKPGHRHKGQGVQTPRHSPEAVGAALGDLPPGPPSEAHEGGGERLALCLTLGFSGGAVPSGVREPGAGGLGGVELGLLWERTTLCKTEVRR